MGAMKWAEKVKTIMIISRQILYLKITICSRTNKKVINWWRRVLIVRQLHKYKSNLICDKIWILWCKSRVRCIQIFLILIIQIQTLLWLFCNHLWFLLHWWNKIAIMKMDLKLIIINKCSKCNKCNKCINIIIRVQYTINHSKLLMTCKWTNLIQIIHLLKMKFKL